ncbi:sulfurtransferase [Pseudolysinimonas sp.]|jgi:thiosulfate/3-mercaptopyruvate sulfurtransferase|uniref:sulfurtransferase n=1 Tax=Pseudolysinimonas sp. TaxID=2680009 RepID=UPI003784095D
MTTPLLITPAELHEVLGAVHLLDVRWRLDRPDGRPDYLAGHIPGAIYVDLDAELADHGRPATAGRHPLPSQSAVQAAARRWGVRRGRTVVVYDDLNNMSAARAWWMLRDGGIDDVRVLDGALGAWRAAGYELETGEVVPMPGDVILRRGVMPSLDIDEAAAFPEFGTLFDARAAERYRGEVEPIDPRAGHIPGAVSAPTAANVDADGRFLAPDVLRQRFLDLGANPGGPVAAYCGSGVTAAHEVLALTLAGFSPALFPGSWSAWSNDSDRPLATGAEPR